MILRFVWGSFWILTLLHINKVQTMSDYRRGTGVWKIPPIIEHADSPIRAFWHARKMFNQKRTLWSRGPSGQQTNAILITLSVPLLVQMTSDYRCPDFWPPKIKSFRKLSSVLQIKFQCSPDSHVTPCTPAYILLYLVYLLKWMLM